MLSDIQEFYELTLLDDTKSIQQKTAETIRIANKWEASDGPIAYTNNDVSKHAHQTKLDYNILFMAKLYASLLARP